ncbi:uncharacterized protein LOC122375515 [Amphibalanus amphitrite]|uniref:uncharacterized protein LOC122375515 n=1 Tax=Amphibalanus amphitrite TaxID=1232801 RepID=UPI001C911F54|nr:uncharacterized protein LOC122375515 [Amphibalanus amphitrite]
MSQSSTEVDHFFNHDGDMQVEVELTEVENPVPDGAPDEAGPAGGGDGPPQPRGRRGPPPGTRRGPYKRIPRDAQERVVAVFNEGGDWKAAATANGIPVRTAYGYITRPEGQLPRPRGGATKKKVTQGMVDKMVTYVEENPLISLVEIGRNLRQDTGVTISVPTIHRHLHGQLFTMKKVVAEPVAMNNAANKQKRAEYVRKMMAATGSGRSVLYMDETNANLFLRRSQGRSRRGLRCSVKAATSKGPNVHIIGLMSQTGIIYWERRRGSFRKTDCSDWLRRALQACPLPLDQVTIVCDNAPVHCDLEAVAAEFPGLELVRTAPYSAPLNPIEAVWSAVKANMKRGMASSFSAMMDTTDGITQQEHRLRYLEAKMDAAMECINPVMCMNFYNHVQRHYAGCVALADLAMGV